MTPVGADQRQDRCKKRTALFVFTDREGDMQPAARQELKLLVEIYAIRTRRLSEGIAVLGAHVANGKPTDEIMTEIKKLVQLMDLAEADLFAFVAQRREEQ
jgi:hypothetical protein